MIVLISVAALVVIGLAVALGLGALDRMSVHAPEPVGSAGGRGLPDGDITSDDVGRLRFDVAVRGYRMEQVDDAMERLRLRIAELEEELLESQGFGTSASGGPYVVDDGRDVDGTAVLPGVTDTGAALRRFGLVGDLRHRPTPVDDHPEGR